MEHPDRETITEFSKRSDQKVMRITLIFALFGAIMEIASGALSAILGISGGIPMLWGIWVPLCFITIPPIHYLCRRVEALQKRIDELEKLSNPPQE